MLSMPERISKYEIRGQLGSGASAVVYQAYDPVIERTLAIKVVDKTRLDVSEEEEVLKRFRIEAKAAGRLQHQNIVAVYDFGEEGHLVFLVMECVFGRPLTAYLQGEDFRSEPDKACEIILQVLGALHYSHTQGVVHRDIKPSNIMVSRDGVIKVADFGVARLESSAMTQTGDLIGTPSYMSPEQFAGDIADPRSDLYATGVILYELLTRRRPFEGANNAIIMNKVFNETPAPPSNVNTVLSRALDVVVARAMAKEAGERYQTAKEFEFAVREAMRHGLLAGSAVPQAAPRIAPTAMRALRQPGATPAIPQVAEPVSTMDDTTLPGVAAQDAFAEVAPAGPVIHAPHSRAVVLFVDDETRILFALHSLFRHKYQVYTADDPRKALEIVKRIPVNVIVSDQRMPGMLGVDLLREVREVSPRSVRILLTGYSDLASIVGSINEGEVWRFINKPWDSQEIQRVLTEAVDIAMGLPEVAPWQMPAPPKFDETILVVDPNGDITPEVLRGFGKRHWVAQVKTLDQALDMLQDREVAVLVADLDADPRTMKSLLHVLKREYPQILTIAVTAAVDAELVIELINEAQVYRFVSRPVNLETLYKHVDSALNRFHTYKASPDLAKAQTVVEEKAQPTSLAAGLINRIKSIRMKWPSFR